MINLSDRKWRAFKTDEILKMSRVLGRTADSYKSGNIPYVSTSSMNNAVIDFVQADDISISKKNCITVDPIKGTCFYHPYDFVGRGFSGASVNTLKSDKINKYIGLFLCTAIENNAKTKASYGYLYNSRRLEKGIIFLPVNTNGDPDYNFMEDYIKERMAIKREEYVEYARCQLAQIERERVDNTVKWLEFRIEDLFEIKSGKRLVKSDIEYGNRPFIGASDSNNGITAWCSNTNSTIDSNVLGVNYNGSVVENFYHPYECIFSDDVKRFHLKNTNGDKYLYLFIKTALIKQKNKYRYAYKFNEKRMNRQTIMLPATTDDKPNYVYMSSYVKSVFADKYGEYLNYAQK